MVQEVNISDQNKNHITEDFKKLFVLIYLKFLDSKTSSPLNLPYVCIDAYHLLLLLLLKKLLQMVEIPRKIYPPYIQHF